MRLLLATMGVAAASFVLGVEPAGACSCDGPVSDAVANSDGAFVGVFTGRGSPAVNHFRVERVIKGDIGARIDVVSTYAGTTCDFGFKPGDRTGLLVARKDDAWTSMLCSRFDPASVPGGVAPAGADAGLDSPAVVVAGVALFAVTVLLAAVAIRRRR